MGRVVRALRMASGIRSVAARALQVCPDTLYRYVREHPGIVDDLKQIEEELVDEAESGLVAALRAGDMRAIQIVLSTNGRRVAGARRSRSTGSCSSTQRRHPR
jgi:hypothetical protein